MNVRYNSHTIRGHRVQEQFKGALRRVVCDTCKLTLWEGPA